MGIDYSKETNWLSKPEPIKEVDTFFLYPSSYFSEKESFRPFAKIDDKGMIKLASKCLESQGGVFAENTNIYAPLYRQVDPNFGFHMIDNNKWHIVEQVTLKDAIDSFDYYIQNINHGRPFIIAGHSQGTTVLMKMMAKYMKEHKELLEKMVAAYLVGDSITEEYMKENPHFKFAQGETDTGVIISWNTEMPNMKEHSKSIQGIPLVINPINWKRDETYASIDENKGSFIKGKIVKPGIADAKVNLKTGILECGSVNPKDYEIGFSFVPLGSYHTMDFAFYFENIKENVKKRIETFKSLHK